MSCINEGRQPCINSHFQTATRFFLENVPFLSCQRFRDQNAAQKDGKPNPSDSRTVTPNLCNRRTKIGNDDTRNSNANPHFKFLRSLKFFSAMKDHQISNIAKLSQVQYFAENQDIVCQGDIGDTFFVVQSGECVARVRQGDDVQVHLRYKEGDVFGERSLLTQTPRAATITATTFVAVLSISRHKFEKHLGPLSQLHEEHYMIDPRKCLADFFMPGNSLGPKGSVELGGSSGSVVGGAEEEDTEWFAVFRPTSRDAIEKMLQRIAVGKGLNVKGKSAKKGFLSGFVPFLQISVQAHKREVEKSPSSARLHIFYRHLEARSVAKLELESLLCECRTSEPPVLDIDDPSIREVDQYSPHVYGLDIPEPLLREAYIIRPDIVPPPNWETGRASEPSFMNMNLHAIREGSLPRVVLLQYDLTDPMNPCGLLVAYAEKSVKPVVSDFDTFTVGSRNMPYMALPDNQLDLARWSLQKTEEVLKKPGKRSWTSRWLDILTRETEQGFYPQVPAYGFGDPTSIRIIENAIDATISCGAVRHGAECFNFWFPQELDNEYLVIWESYGQVKPWKYLSEDELRRFLLDRAKEGYSFPLNPVWPVRDPGWYDILQALVEQSDAAEKIDCTIRSWYPDSSGILEQIDRLRLQYSNGFFLRNQAARRGSEEGRGSLFNSDLDNRERLELGLHQVQQAHQKLIAEIRDGRSKFSIDEDGSLVRNVSVMVLNLTNPENLLLVQVWDSANDEDIRYRLPGQKLKEGQDSDLAIQQMARAKLCLPNDVEIISEETTHVKKQSLTYSVQTQYTRHVYRAHVSDVSDYELSRIVLDNETGALKCLIDDGLDEPEWVEIAPEDLSCPLDNQVEPGEDGESLYDTKSGRQIFAIRHEEDLDRFTVVSWMTAEDLAKLDGSAEHAQGSDASTDLRRHSFDVVLDRLASVNENDVDPTNVDNDEMAMRPIESRRKTEPVDQKMWMQACRSERHKKRSSSSGTKEPLSPKYPNGFAKNGHG